MKTFSICFYVFDLLILAVMTFSVNHTMVFPSWWGLIISYAVFMLRLALPFLMFYKVRWRILPIVAFTLLFGYAVKVDIFENLVFRMGQYPSVILHNEDLLQGENFFCSNLTDGGFLMWCIILWTWLMPCIVYLIQFCRQYSISITIKKK